MTKEEFEKRAVSYGRTHGLWERGSRILAAVSGGPDSLALLLFLHETAEQEGFSMGCCCVNHHLREEAEAETEYVRSVCRELGIPFYRRDVQVEAVRRESGESEETAARRLRYEALEEVRTEGQYTFIAAAHHLDDQAETVIFRFLRGSGGKGLSGMRPKRGVIIRPFLGMTKKEIGEYLSYFPFEPCHDATNDIPEAARNKIRLELLPLLKQYNPALPRTLARTADILREDEEYLEHLAEERAEELLLYRGKHTVFLSRTVLRALPLPTERRLLRRFLAQSAEKEIDFDGLLRLEAWLREGKNGGEMSLSGVYVQREKDWFSLRKGSTRARTAPDTADLLRFLYGQVTGNGKNRGGEYCRIAIKNNTDIIKYSRFLSAGPWTLLIEETDRKPEVLRKDQYLLDGSRIGELRLSLSGRDGLFCPRGTEGTKRVRDILREKGIPAEARPYWPIVADGEHVYWIGFLRGSRFGQPDGNTSRFVRLTLMWNEKENF